MLLLSAMLVIFALGIAMVLAARLSEDRGVSRSILTGGGLFLTIFGLLWSASLLLPTVASWLVAALGVSVLAFVRTPREGRSQIISFLLIAGLAVLVFHFTLALLDVAMSTREFSSDWDLLLAATNRSASAASLRSLIPLLGLIAVGVLIGRLLGSVLNQAPRRS